MKIANGVAKELRHYIGAIGIFLLVIGILIFLSYNCEKYTFEDVMKILHKLFVLVYNTSQYTD